MEKSDLLELVRGLPVFSDTLLAEADQAKIGSETSSLLKSYLQFYDIDFSSRDSDLQHRIGIVESEGYQLVTQTWIQKDARATLYVVHGYLDHVGAFSHVLRFALENNFSICAFDLPGHGLSSGEPAAIASFDEYGDALQAVFDATGTSVPGPKHILAQSTGGAVVLNHLWRYDADAFERVVLLAPLIRSYGWRSARVLFFLLKNFVRSTPRHFNNNTHNADFIEFLKHSDPLQAKVIPMRWVNAMRLWQKQFSSFEPMEKPILLIQGDADTTVDGPYNCRRIQEKVPTADLKLIPGLRHQIANESVSYREQVFACVLDFLAS
jgi:alpha-beta hydrolase superfamily lysophospholipase